MVCMCYSLAGASALRSALGGGSFGGGLGSAASLGSTIHGSALHFLGGAFLGTGLGALLRASLGASLGATSHELVQKGFIVLAISH